MTSCAIPSAPRKRAATARRGGADGMAAATSFMRLHHQAPAHFPHPGLPPGAGGGEYRCCSQRSPIWRFCAACNQQGVVIVQLVTGLETLCTR